MDVAAILNALRAERERLERAISALEGSGGGNGRRGRRGPRVMSAEARKRISAAMKAKWAERKKKAKTA